MESNLPEQPTSNISKIKASFRDNLQFLRGVLYLTKKVFML